MAGKFALIIGNSQYEDSSLGRLTAPAVDVRGLEEVLKAPDIGQFDDVTTLIDQDFASVRRAVARFYDLRQRDDLLFLYFSGHGVKDEQGHLFLALRDTDSRLLSGTAIETLFISGQMDRSFSKRQVLVLDCCHSGAFAHGTKAAQGLSVGTADAFEGTGLGRVVLTATDATQYALEGNQVIGNAQHSLFTHFLIDGLKTGAADRDRDGVVTIDELYEHVREQVLNTTPRQMPQKWAYRQPGEIVLAKNPLAKASKRPARAVAAEIRSERPPSSTSENRRTEKAASDIFISYAREDQARAKSLAAVLRDRGWSVWWDRKIAPGEQFDVVIERELGICRCAIVLWSKHSVNATWVRNEARRAAKRKVLVPIFIDEVDPPLEFENLQAADLTTWETGADHPELEVIFDRVRALSPVPHDARAEEETQAAEEAERQREEAERRRAAGEAERRRAAEEAEHKRVAQEAERQRVEAERRRAAADAERQRLAEAKQREAEEAERARAAKEAERRRAAEEAERRRVAEEAERQRVENEKRQAAEEAERQRLAEAKRRAAEEAERQRVEKEKRRAAEEAERRRVEAERKRAAEEAERKRAAEEAERRRIEAARQLDAQHAETVVLPASVERPGEEPQPLPPPRRSSRLAAYAAVAAIAIVLAVTLLVMRRPRPEPAPLSTVAPSPTDQVAPPQPPTTTTVVSDRPDSPTAKPTPNVPSTPTADARSTDARSADGKSADVKSSDTTKQVARLDELRTIARRHQQAGRSSQALDAAAEGLKLDAKDAPLRGVVSALLQDAQASADRAKQQARGARRDLEITPEFNQAVEKQTEAAKLHRSGDDVAAVRSLWAAAEDFAKVAERYRYLIAKGPEAKADPVPVSPSPPEPSRAKPQNDPAPAVEKHPDPAMAEPAPLPPAPSPRDQPLGDEQRIRQLLNDYKAAYEQMDAAAVNRLQPSLSQGQLANTFKQYRAFAMSIADVKTLLSGNSAVVTCTITTNIRPRVGDTQSFTRPTTLRMQKTGETWVIVDRR